MHKARDGFVIVSICLFVTLWHMPTYADEPLCVASTGKWAPFNMIREGKLVGIGIDYWEEIAKRLKVSYRYEIKERWEDVLQAIKTRACDLTVATQQTPSREVYALFSKPYADYPVVIVTDLKSGFIDSIDLISSKTVAMPRHYATTEMLLRKYPDLHILYTENIDEALQKVAEGEAFATVGVLPVVAYKINTRLKNLKISGKTDMRFQVGFMLRRDNRELLERINRAIDAISDETKRRIYEKWILHEDERQSLPLWVKWVGIAGLIVFLGLLIYIYHMRKKVADHQDDVRYLKTMAFVDHGTGAYSRAYVLDYLDTLWEQAERGDETFGIIFFDIDHMKIINDTFGHDKGDEVLRKVAKTVMKHLRKEDVLGRWGGDEFLIVLPRTDEFSLKKLTSRLVQATRRIEVSAEYTVSCSYGYAAYCKGDTLKSLFGRADKRLYEVKKRHHARLQKQIDRLRESYPPSSS